MLVGGEVDADLSRIHASLFQQQSADADTSMSARMTNPIDNALSKLAGSVRMDCSFGDKRAARSAISKVWQDGMVSSGLFMHGYVGQPAFSSISISENKCKTLLTQLLHLVRKHTVAYLLLARKTVIVMHGFELIFI